MKILQNVQLADFYKWLVNSELDRLGWQSWLEPMSNTVYFKRPPKEITEKYMLAPDVDERLGGDLSHIIVMQHVTKDKIKEFIADLSSHIENSK